MLGGAHDETRLLESLLADLESGKLPPESLLIVQRLAASKRPGSGDEVSLWRRCLALLSPDAAEAAQAIRERIARVDPTDSVVRIELGRQYAASGRHRDHVRLL